MIPKPIDRPILQLEDDILEREPIVRRIAGSLVTVSGAPTGIVVGVVGEWGSGKSSILNLLEEQVRSSHPNAVIVRFNPWQITNSEDLTAKYFEEIVAAIRPKFGKQNPWRCRRDQVVDETVDAVVAYASELTSLLDFVPALAWVMTALGRVGDRYLRKKASLSSQKKRLQESLDNLNSPFVVLIDELDRIDENEVRLMAQLVRSVADFPQFSYVLAYDHKRVASALGGSVGKRKERLERGMHYLEKIVQIEVRVPLMLEPEIGKLFESEVRQVVSQAETKLTAYDEKRLERIIGLLAAQVASTPRTVKRLIGSFQGRYLMLAGEVSAPDALGYSALEIVAPAIVDHLSRNVDEVVFNPRNPTSRILVHAGKLTIESWVEKIDPLNHKKAAAITLSADLFPAISKSRTSEDCGPDDIAFRRPLFTLVRMLPPADAFTRSEVMKFLELSDSDKASFLKEVIRSPRAQEFLERLEELYPALVTDHKTIWLLLAEMVEHDDDHPGFSEKYRRREACRDIAYMLLRSCRRTQKLRETLETLLMEFIERGENYIPAIILRLERRAQSDQRGATGVYSQPYLTSTQIGSVGRRLEASIRLLIATSGYPAIRDATLLYFLRDFEAWTQSDREDLLQKMRSDSVIVDQITFWLFSANYSAEKSGIDVLVDYASYAERLVERSRKMKEVSNDEMLRLSYERAIDHLNLDS